MSVVTISEEVRAALADARPVVALETAVVTAGLPRTPQSAPQTASLAAWDAAAPANYEAARALERAVRRGNAVPAMVAILDGVLRIGLGDDDLARLAADTDAGKASSSGLAAALATGGSAGTTVSGTLVACRVAGIEVFATGGLGGVHRDWARHPDISADLGELARARCCVVCSGPKAVLDVPATAEALETLGVPVVGYETDALPRFYATPDPEQPVSRRLDDPAAIGRMCRLRWTTLDQPGAVVVARPVPAAWALDVDEIETALTLAEAKAAAHGIAGPALTPYLLDAVATATEGRSLRANLALLAGNAALAADVAVALAALPAAGV